MSTLFFHFIYGFILVKTIETSERQTHLGRKNKRQRADEG